MKTITLHEFSDLSQDTKKYALLENSCTQEYLWDNESINSLKGFLSWFWCNIKEYSVDFLEPAKNHFSIDYSELKESEIKKRLDNLGAFNPATFKGVGECKLTGFEKDESCIDGFRRAWYEGERDLTNLIYAGIRTWEQAVKSDYEYQLSEDGYKEYCENNNCLFNESGKLIVL